MDWTPLLVSCLTAGLSMAYLWGALRILDNCVTRVRGRFGLGAAWGTAILGFAAIVGGIGAIVAIRFALFGAPS